jgi:hypothetical protein
MKTKKIFLAFTALVISASAFSQVDTARRDTSARKDTIHRRDTTAITTQQSATVSQSETSAATTSTTSSDITVPKPNHGRYYIPVLGTYQAQDANAAATSVSITADETNPGKVWIEGLADTRFYALLKSVPGTYKIPAQKQSEKPVAEGEIRYDESNKSITICVGCGFHDENTTIAEPVAASTAKNTGSAKAAKKAKSTIISFSGVKTNSGAVSLR